MSFYTYVHFRQDTNKVFYVGKGKDGRAYSKKDRNKHWKHVANKCGYRVEIASEWLSESEALEHERFLIACFKDLEHPLVNYTDGGEGVSGYRHSEEAKKRIAVAASKARKGVQVGPQSPELIERRISKLRGRKKPPEVCQAISAAKKGKSNGRKGYRHSADTIAKIKANSVGWKHTPEQIERMKQAWVLRKAKMKEAAK